MKLDFEIPTTYGIYRDALILDDENPPTATEIEALKQARVDAWLAHIEAASQVSTPDDVVYLEGQPYRRTEVDGQVVLMPIEE